MSGFPDVEAMVLDFLDARIDVEVGTFIPEKRIAPFLRVFRNGGPAVNRILERALVTVEVWASDASTAAGIAGQARDALLNEYTAMPLVRGANEVTGPYSIADSESGTPRYRFSTQLTVRAART